jgi:hypothetical protein
MTQDPAAIRAFLSSVQRAQRSWYVAFHQPPPPPAGVAVLRPKTAEEVAAWRVRNWKLFEPYRPEILELDADADLAPFLDQLLLWPPGVPLWVVFCPDKAPPRLSVRARVSLEEGRPVWDRLPNGEYHVHDLTAFPHQLSGAVRHQTRAGEELSGRT